MPDEENGRTTSYSKTIDPDYERMVAERNLRLRDSFDRAKAAEHALEEQRGKPAERSRGGSHAPAPQQHLRPQGPARRAVDRRMHGAAQAKENATSLLETYKARNDRLKTVELDHERDRDQNERSH